MFKKIKGYFKKKFSKDMIDGVPIIDLGQFGLWDNPYNENDLAAMISDFDKKKREKKPRIQVKPMDIIHDFEASVDFPMDKVKEAAKAMEARIKFIKDTFTHGNTDDEERALDMLKARIKFPNVSHLFCWKTTTDKHIKKLLDKYDLEHRDIRSYIRSIPDEAIQSMQIYTKLLKKVSKKTPHFTLIAPPKYFKDDKNRSVDPILLANSPFGLFYYILVAWDKEIGMVSELLDGEELVVDKN